MIGSIISLYFLQFIVVWLAIGFATAASGDLMDCDEAMKIAAIWPFVLPYKAIRWFITGPCLFIAKAAFLLIVPPLTEPHRQKQRLAARCDEQHTAYIEGLLTQSDDLYNKGFYGEYPPAKEVA
jgi:hypothetical protein